MIHMALRALAIAALVGATGCKTTELAPRTTNPGSHPAPWIANVLLPGRVTIQFEGWTHGWKNWFVTTAAYHTEDRGRLICSGEKRRYRERVTDYYAVTAWELGTAALNYSSEPRPVFYDPASGRFHTEAWDGSSSRWGIESDGWIQEGWPRLMADACPGITQEILDRGGWINEKQTHPTIYRMLEQDPTAPLVLAAAPATRHLGIGAALDNPRWWCFASPSKPVLPAHCYPEGEETPGDAGAALQLPESPDEAAGYLARLALANALRMAHGHVLEDRLGRAYVLALGNPDELWAVDGEGQLTDVGYLAWNAATETLELDWELKGEAANFHYRPDDPLPVIDTGRRHPLFAMADWLVASEADVTLPFMGRQALFRFDERGALTVRGIERDFAGRWLVSRGRLVLEVDGIAERAGYRWDLLAGHLTATTEWRG